MDVDHNGKVDLREFIVMMYNQVNAINRLVLTTSKLFGEFLSFGELNNLKHTKVGITDDMEEMRIAFRQD